jgi:hypothetical protein
MKCLIDLCQVMEAPHGDLQSCLEMAKVKLVLVRNNVKMVA